MIITRNAAHLLVKMMTLMDAEQMEDVGFTSYEIDFADELFDVLDARLAVLIGEDYLETEVL